MELDTLVKKMDCSLICGKTDKKCSGIYVGDFLSHVISKLPENHVWLTIMNNVNVAAVASLTEACAVVLCENIQPDEKLIKSCSENGITLLTTKKTAFEAIRDSL